MQATLSAAHHRQVWASSPGQIRSPGQVTSPALRCYVDYERVDVADAIGGMS